jgi:hypothetical protein
MYNILQSKFTMQCFFFQSWEIFIHNKVIHRGRDFKKIEKRRSSALGFKGVNKI